MYIDSCSSPVGGFAAQKCFKLTVGRVRFGVYLGSRFGLVGKSKPCSISEIVCASPEDSSREI